MINKDLIKLVFGSIMENVLQSRYIKINSRSFFFSQKIKKVYQPPLLFNDSTFQQISTQKHLGIHFDEELTYKHHINEKINKGNKGIGIIRNYSVVRRLK